MKIRVLVGLSMVVSSMLSFAEPNVIPTVVGVDFADAVVVGDHIQLDTEAEWIREIRHAHGRFDDEANAWIAEDVQGYGVGRLVVSLNRKALPADLALTLVYEETPGTDFVVQLWDDRGGILAADLFSNIIVAGREAQADTFIVPFSDYPTATQLVLRRLTGEVRIYGLVLYPVACKLPATTCEEEELAAELGDTLSEDNPLVQEATRIAESQEKAIAWNAYQMQQRTRLEDRNRLAYDTLATQGYPEFVPSIATLEGQFLVANTGSALYFISQALRTLNLYHPGIHGEVVGASLTSDDAKDLLLARAAPVGVMSVPMEVADKERFFSENGHHLIEAPIAIDAIQVVVNEDNPIRQLTIPQLDAIYGTELRAGATQVADTWADVGVSGSLADVPIDVWGGKKGGTYRVFQKLVLQGGPYAEYVLHDDVGYYGGMVRHVASNRNAIAYANLQHHWRGARKLAIAAQTGKPAFLPEAGPVYAGNYPLTRYLYMYVDAPSIDEIDPVTKELLRLVYSKEGQSVFGMVGQIPLHLGLVNELRGRLGL